MGAATQTVSAASIAAQLFALDGALADFEQQADALSLLAVQGDKEAAKEIAEVNAKIAAAQADRLVLQRAQSQAADIERKKREDDLAANRDKHIAAARDHAKALIVQADKADALAATLIAELHKIAELERSVHAALKAAGEPRNDAVVGRNGVDQYVRDRITTAFSGRAYDRTERRSGHWARVGWRDLLEGFGDD